MPTDDITAAELTDELERARRIAARALDRSNALADLRLKLLEASNRHHRAVTLAELFGEADGGGERYVAELQGLVDRITGDTFTRPLSREE